jgi:hypothetical protein
MLMQEQEEMRRRIDLERAAEAERKTREEEGLVRKEEERKRVERERKEEEERREAILAEKMKKEEEKRKEEEAAKQQALERAEKNILERERPPTPIQPKVLFSPLFVLLSSFLRSFFFISSQSEPVHLFSRRPPPGFCGRYLPMSTNKRTVHFLHSKL